MRARAAGLASRRSLLRDVVDRIVVADDSIQVLLRP